MPKLSFFFPIIFIGVFTQAEELSLQKAIFEASSNSPKIQKAKSVFEENSWKRVESYSGFLPSLSMSSSYLTSYRYMLTDINLGGGPVSVPAILPTTNHVFTAQLPIFDGFASTNRYLSARSFESAAEKDYQWTQFQVEREVALQFYKTLGAQLLKLVAEQNIKTLEDHLNDVKQFKKAGVSTNYDVLRVEVQVSQARSELLNTDDNIEINKSRLAEILGSDNEKRALQGKIPILHPGLIKNLNIENVRTRSDLAALQQKAQGFDELESSSSRYWIPKINLFGQYQYYNNRNDHFNDSDNFREAYQVGVSLVWNIFDGMVSIARSKESIEQRYQAEKTLRIAQLKAKQDLDVWKRKFLYFCNVYKSRVEDVEKSTESVRLAKAGRRFGSRTNTDLLDAEGELYRAKAEEVNAQIGSIEALINLELATGQKIYDFN